MKHLPRGESSYTHGSSQPTVAETWEQIKPFSPAVSVGVHSHFRDGRELVAADASGLPSGSFKERGAIVKTRKLVGEGRTEATLFSAGNYLIGAALGARATGMFVHGFVPEYAPQLKIDKSILLGGGNMTVSRVDGGFVETRDAALAYAEKHEIPVLEPYDDEDVARGQGTVAHELLMRHPDIDHLLVPAGGGGLLAGCIEAIQQAGLHTKVYGVKLSSNGELCEGSHVAELGDTAKAVIYRNPELWGGMKRVDPADVGAMIAYEDDIRGEHGAAMGEAAYKDFPEPTALLGAAAAHKYFQELGGNVATIITGSNTDPIKLGKLHERYLERRDDTKATPRSLQVASAFHLRRRAA